MKKLYLQGHDQESPGFCVICTFICLVLAWQWYFLENCNHFWSKIQWKGKIFFAHFVINVAWNTVEPRNSKLSFVTNFFYYCEVFYYWGVSRLSFFYRISIYVFQQRLYLQLIMYKVIHIIFSINNELFQGQLIHSKIVC